MNKIAYLLAILLAIAPGAIAETYTKHKDNAEYTHYYNSKGHQTCISKKDAAGYTHTYCDEDN